MKAGDNCEVPKEVVEASRSTGLLDTEPEEAFDRLTMLASRLAGAPSALLTILDQNRQFFKSTVNVDEKLEQTRETPLSQSFCKFVAGSNSPLVIPDARSHPLTESNSVIDAYGIEAYCGVPLRLSNGTPFGALCVIDDHPRGWEDSLPVLLDELARSAVTEMELRQKTRHLEALTARQNEILGTVAHDLRTPIAVVKGYSSLLLEQKLELPEKYSPMVQAIRRSGDFMLRLVDDILDLESLKSGKVTLDLQSVDVIGLVEGVIELLRYRADLKSVQVGFSANRSSWLIQLDPRKFEQVIQNVVGNAIKFSPSGTTVSVELQAQESDFRIDVKDQGPGLSEKEAECIFEPFATGKAKSTDGEKSTGLGLSIAQKIVQAHGGKITARGNSTGAIFSIVVPRPQ